MRVAQAANKILKKSKTQGQGTLEFILLLVVLVGILLAFNHKIFKPFGDYTKAYMGGYLACLLDKGVLPKLKSDDDSCADALKVGPDNPFNPKNSNIAGSKNGGNGANTPRPSEINDASNSRAGGAVSSSNNASNGRPRNNNSRNTDGGGADNKTTVVAATLSDSKYYKVSRYGSASSSGGAVVRVIGLSGLLAAERDRLQRREDRVSKLGQLESDEATGKPKKLKIGLNNRKPAAIVEDEPMTFGNWIRIIIIVTILIAILAFMGMQANQITKSWEK